MIKVQNDLSRDKKNPLACVLQDKTVHEYLHDMGVLLDRHAHPDYVFTMANTLKEPKENTIAFERIDGCQIKNKHLLSHKNVLKLVKMYKYATHNVNNLSSVHGRLFTRHLAPHEEWQEVKRKISVAEFSKVHTGVNFLHYKRHDKCELRAKNYEDYINKDVFFAGSTESYAKKDHASGKVVSRHRLDCVDALDKVDCKKLVVANKAFNATDYLNHIATARITVSPWGWGESCYRDYEALMLRTDVIKPRSYNIESLPDIYNGTVFYCNPNWSDLPEVIEKCLNTWNERTEQREEIAKNVIEWRQPETIAKMLRDLL